MENAALKRPTERMGWLPARAALQCLRSSAYSFCKAEAGNQSESDPAVLPPNP